MITDHDQRFFSIQLIFFSRGIFATTIDRDKEGGLFPFPLLPSLLPNLKTACLGLGLVLVTSDRVSVFRNRITVEKPQNRNRKSVCLGYDR